MSEQQRESHVQIFGVALRRTTLLRMQGAVFSVLGVGWLAESLLVAQPAVWWQIVKVVLGVLFIVIGLGLLFAHVNVANDD